VTTHVWVIVSDALTKTSPAARDLSFVLTSS
jgi:hypothetical protein